MAGVSYFWARVDTGFFTYNHPSNSHMSFLASAITFHIAFSFSTMDKQMLFVTNFQMGFFNL